MSVLELLEGKKNVFIFSNFRSRVGKKRAIGKRPAFSARFCLLGINGNSRAGGIFVSFSNRFFTHPSDKNCFYIFKRGGIAHTNRQKKEK